MTARGRTISVGGLAKAGSDLGLAAMFVLFAYVHAMAFVRNPRASLVLIVVLELLFAVFSVIRRPPRDTAVSPVDWISTLAGMFLPLFLRPTQNSDVLAGQVLQMVGVAYGMFSLLSLSRSFGLLPANRGVRTSGAFRYVRHPLYSSYLLGLAGYVSTHTSAWNLAIVFGHLVAQLIRMQREERLLSRDPEYTAYTAKTRWRLVPYLY